MRINRKTKEQRTRAKPKKTKLLRECLVLTQQMFFWVLKWKNQNMVWMDMINQDQSRSQKPKILKFFWFFNILGLVFCIEKFHQFFFCFLRSSFFISIQKSKIPNVFLLFYFRTRKTKKNRENQRTTLVWVKTKLSLDSFDFLFRLNCFLFAFPGFTLIGSGTSTSSQVLVRY